MATSEDAAIGQALVDFALDGNFPDESVSTRRIGAQDFAAALKSLSAARSALESEVHTINEETAPDVGSWITNAKTLEDDINRSRSLANEIVRRAEAPEVSGQTIREAEEKAEFLQRESAYNRQVYGALSSIKRVNELLDQVEQASDERRILDSLRLLEQSWVAQDEIPASKSCRIMRLLDMRAFELKSSVHDIFEHIWKSLVYVNTEKGQMQIHQKREDEAMSLSEAVIGLKAYKELDQRMALLWHQVDDAIITPRTNVEEKTLPGIIIDNSQLSLQGQVDNSISSLFMDLTKIMSYFSEHLPHELIQSLSVVMMPDIIPRIKLNWLDAVVPCSLQDIDEFQEVLESTRRFCHALKELHYTGYSELQDWVDAAPRVWLTKCRETALDTVRSKLSQGLGEPKEVERVETQQVSRTEGADLAANGAPTTADDDDWGSAWDDGGGSNTEPASSDRVSDPNVHSREEDGADAWGWGEADEAEQANTHQASEVITGPNADDGGDAWGWGEDDPTEQQARQATNHQPPVNPKTREMTLRETYKISSMPEPVIALIAAILEDGATLTGSTNNPVAAAAAGLFGLPTFVLAMFRAVSPYYYALDISGGGSMFLYNDVTYLSERLVDLVASWKARDDLTPRALSMLRLDNDIKTLKSFAARAYASEMTTQRTIVCDLLGGLQNILQQDGDTSDLISQVEAASGRVRAMASIWSSILSKSAWCQAVGSLVNTLAEKIVSDVMDLSGIGQDEAYNIANLIAKITELDDLFLPPGASEDEVPTTSQYAEHWLRLKFLSEVLQSNLNEVKYLWIDSDLSLYFTVDEVVDLIGLSFVDNARTRDVVREIRSNPQPRI